MHGTDLLFQIKEIGNYIVEMESKIFGELVHNFLVPNIPPKSFIIVDNGAWFRSGLESVVPTLSSRKNKHARLVSDSCNSVSRIFLEVKLACNNKSI